MRSTTFAVALGSLLLLNLSASADTFTLNMTGNAYDADEFSGFTLSGTGLSIDVAQDFGPLDKGVVQGQSYSLSYSFGSETFNGQYNGVPITGNGTITWQFTIAIPIVPLDASPILQVPGTVTGQFSFCAPPTLERVSACGPGDNPLGSATFMGTGTDTADLVCGAAGGSCGLYADYLEPFTATAVVTTVPEPPSLALILGSSLLVYPLRYVWRPSSRHLQPLRFS